MNLNFNFTPRQALIGGGIILGVLLLVGIIVVVNLFGRVGSLSDERDASAAELEQLDAQVQDLEDLRNNAGDLERRVLELNRRVPEEPEIPTFLVQVQEIADAAGVTQVLLEPQTPGPPEGGGPYSVVPVTMTFEGTYENLQDFLLRSNDLTRLVTVKSVSYAPVEGEDGVTELGVERILLVEIEAEVYFQPQGADGQEAPVSPITPTTETETETTTIVEETAGGGRGDR